MSPPLLSVHEIRSLYEQHGQSHVLQFYEELTSTEQEDLLNQLRSIPVAKLALFHEAALQNESTTFSSSSSSSSSTPAPIEPFAGVVGRTTSDSQECQDLVSSSRAVGLEAISRGHVAALVLAGGQGTRLGFDGPKGLLNIGLPSGMTLFQLMAERLKKISQLAVAATNTTRGSSSAEEASACCRIPFYIMTSPLNHDATVQYFEENNYFGLGKDNVTLFPQGMLPCLTDPGGKILLESKSRVAMAPDGNGGVYPALVSSGALDNLLTRDVRYLHVFSVDNALIRPADPVFVGYCIAQNADCGNKVVWKAHPHEAVGVLASKSGGQPCVVEYSEITSSMAEQLDETTGTLVYGAANIANHFYTLEFLRDTIVPHMGHMYHVARKKIPYYDAERDETVKPASNNGIKLETFIFDVFPLSQRMAVLEVSRAGEFAPVKNAVGAASDSPDTARRMISAVAQQWIQAAGGTLTGDRENLCEVAPSTSYAGEGLEDVVQGMGGTVSCPFLL